MNTKEELSNLLQTEAVYVSEMNVLIKAFTIYPFEDTFDKLMSNYENNKKLTVTRKRTVDERSNIIFYYEKIKIQSNDDNEVIKATNTIVDTIKNEFNEEKLRKEIMGWIEVGEPKFYLKSQVKLKTK